MILNGTHEVHVHHVDGPQLRGLSEVEVPLVAGSENVTVESCSFAAGSSEMQDGQIGALCVDKALLIEE